MIIVSFDVKKLDKARFFQGKKGLYCELVLIETPGGEYGDYMVKQGVTKEEREQRIEMPILGNAKNVGGQRQNPGHDTRKPAAKPTQPDPDLDQPNEDIPW
jgi:hypothetical protein